MEQYEVSVPATLFFYVVAESDDAALEKVFDQAPENANSIVATYEHAEAEVV